MPASPRCPYCNQESTYLSYYSKDYPSGKSTIETPIFTCSDCIPKAKADLSICRGGIEGIRVISFKEIGKWREKEIGFITSKKGKETNHLASKAYRQLLFSIHYRNRPSKKEILIDHLNWYQKNLENKIKEDFNREVSTLLDCTHTILRDIQK